MSEKIIGIYLGTINSAACVCIDGKPTMIPNSESASVNENIFPSYVAFTESGEVLVGEPAKEQAVTNPENTIKAIKREMGTDYKVNIQGKSYSPQEILAFIFKKIKKDTETFLGEEISKAVITVPAYFDDNQRAATRDAGTFAGLEVVRLLNEPIAVCLSYVIDKLDDESNILVFDIGEGTLDITIIGFDKGIFEIHSTSGDTHLGGRDIVLALKKYLNDEFKKEHGIDLSKDEQADMRLEEATEKAKIELSHTVQTQVNLPFIVMGNDGKPLNFITDLDRLTLKSLIDPILKRCGETIQRALDDAVMKPEDIDKIISIGDSSTIFFVRQYLENYIGKKVESDINPLECLAQGAALQGYIMNSESFSKKFFDPFTPLSLGIEDYDGTFSVIIKRNTPIPIRQSHIYSVMDNQTSFQVNVFQGERRIASDNKFLDSFILEGIQPAPWGVPQIEITFEIDPDENLTVTAKELSSGIHKSITIEANKILCVEDFQKVIEDAKKYEEAIKKEKLAKLFNDADGAIYAAEKFLNNYENRINSFEKKNIEILISQLKIAIAEKSPIQISIKIKELKIAISQKEDNPY